MRTSCSVSRRALCAIASSTTPAAHSATRTASANRNISGLLPRMRRPPPSCMPAAGAGAWAAGAGNATTSHRLATLTCATPGFFPGGETRDGSLNRFTRAAPGEPAGRGLRGAPPPSRRIRSGGARRARNAPGAEEHAWGETQSGGRLQVLGNPGEPAPDVLLREVGSWLNFVRNEEERIDELWEKLRCLVFRRIISVIALLTIGISPVFPVTPAVAQDGAPTNDYWWPNRLSLEPLRQTSRESNPLGASCEKRVRPDFLPRRRGKGRSAGGTATLAGLE